MGSRSPAQPTPEPRVGDYVVATTEIGKGSFAVVHKGHHARRPRTAVAIKIVSRALLTDKLVANLEGEISILRSISHPNVVELYDCIKTDDHIYLVMAFCPWGDLSMYIKSHGQLPSMPAQPAAADPVYSSAELSASVMANSTLMAAIPDPFAAINAVWDDVKNFPHPPGSGLNPWVVRSFLFQLCSALEFMWDKHIVHRDIKPQNLLLQPAGPEFLATGHPLGIPQIKVADFGFARHLPAASLAETLCGSPLYMAPEILRREKYGAKADLWSVGAVTYEMATGKPPFNAANYLELLRRIEKNDDRIRFPDERSERGIARENARRLKDNLPPYERPPAIPDDIKGIIRSLLKRRAVERAGFDDLFRSDAVASGSGSRLAHALGRSVPSTAPRDRVPPPAHMASSPPHYRERDTSRTVTPSTKQAVISVPPPTTPVLPAVISNATSHPISNSTPAAPPTASSPTIPIYPPPRSRAKPIPGSSPRLRADLHPGTFPRSLPAVNTARSQPGIGGGGASDTFGAPAVPRAGVSVSPTSLPGMELGLSPGSDQSARPSTARSTTVGFTPLAALPSPRSRAESLAAPASGGLMLSPRGTPPRGSSLGTPSGSSDNVTPLATPKRLSVVQLGAGSSSCDASKVLSSATASKPPVDASERSQGSSSINRGCGSSDKASPTSRSVGEDGLLDGEYAMVDDRAMRAASKADTFPVMLGFPGTFSPSSAQAAASAARAAAVAAFGASPIRRLSRIRTPSFVKLGGAVLGGHPSPHDQQPPQPMSPALLPDRTTRPSPEGSPVPALLHARTMSAAELTMDKLSTSPSRMQPRTPSSLQTHTPGSIEGRKTRHVSISGPTMPSPSPGPPLQHPMAPTSSMTGGSRPLPIPHSPALALAPHQRPASFHRRSSTSFSGSGKSYSPRFGQALIPALAGAGRTVSPVPSGSSPVASSPISLRFSSRTSSFGQETQPRAVQRTSTGLYGMSLPAPSDLYSPTLDLSSGGLSTGGNASPYRNVPPIPTVSSSLSRALSMAAARLQGAPTSTTPLRNAQAIVRGERRSQSISGTGGLSAQHLVAGTSLDPMVGAMADLDPGERRMLETLYDLDKKALVLTELGNYLLRPHGTFGTLALDGDGRGTSPYPGASHAHRPSVGSGRSSSSLSMASAMAGERDAGTPGTTPSSTPFNSGSVLGAFHSCPPLAPISDAEAVAAECLLIYVRAASLVERALNEARAFFEARNASHVSRGISPELLEKTRILQRRFREIQDQIEMIMAWIGEGDALHPHEDINQLILHMAKQMAKGAALDDWNRHQPHSTPPSSPSISTSATASHSAGLSFDSRRRPSSSQEDKEWNPQQCILAYEMAETLFLTLLDPSSEDLSPALPPQEAIAVEKYLHSIGKRLAALRSTCDGRTMPLPSS